ncbi:hypothetical protein AXK57_07395 [Tsukamurella pulmonis]|uniref:hypothetical protein n=1 Tax=Tsukamurella pulmonis TaxID=47312 RepID=UPI0007986EAB|nr:hypothetical protein [Tsukamurella pulmonis]KXP11173.1 hypothetical protein AXK57_07395 [Tsukamurella pulmonis]RDH11314.1 hypothetical protein DVB88_13500 [Tsukamurella pulmonis]
MSTRTRSIATATAALAGTVLVTGCTVAGTGSADPSAVAAYQSTIAASRAAAAESARVSACAAWETNVDTRLVATRATTAFTKDPNWQWDGIAGLVNAELAAIETESGKLPGIVATPNLQESLKTLFSQYKTKLDAYGVALRADAQARGSGDQTWPKRNPASSAMVDTLERIEAVCPSR